MKKEDYVINMPEPNFKDSTGSQYHIVKIGGKYECFYKDISGKWTSLTYDDLYYFIPLPTAKPQPKRVKLQTVNGDDVWVDWVATHKCNNEERMLFRNTNDPKKPFVVIGENAKSPWSTNKFHIENMYIPLPSPNPVADKINAQIDKVIDSANLDCVKDELRELKNIIKEVL